MRISDWSSDVCSSDLGIDDDDVDIDDLFEMISQGEGTEESRETEVVELEDKRRFGIATLGALKQHPRITAFRYFIEGWYLSYFTTAAARGLPLAGPQDRMSVVSGKHVSVRGDLGCGRVIKKKT